MKPTTTLMRCTNAHTQGFLIHMLWLSLDLLSTGSQPVNGASNSIRARWKLPTEWPGMWQITQISRKFSVFCLVWSGSGSWPAPDNGDMGTLASPGSGKLSPTLISWEAFCDAHMLRTFIIKEIVKILKLFFWQEYIPEELVWRHNCVRSLFSGDQARLKLLVIIVYHREKLL